jgi:CDP-diacylglycerol--serine O-phosphatidyltransferase
LAATALIPYFWPNQKKMKKAVPHILTLGNLVCGVLAIRAIVTGEPVLAITFVFIAAVLDFFDGFVARALGVSGELGKQLDSLADNVTFGVVPGFMLLSIAGLGGRNPEDVLGWMLFGACLLVPAMATLRLAIFNISTNQTSGFIGMPTPGNTLLIASLYYMFHEDMNSTVAQVLSEPVWLFIIALVAGVWQIVPIPLMALKFKTWGIKENLWRYLFLLVSLILLIGLQVGGIPIIIVCYFLFSMVANFSTKKAL